MVSVVAICYIPYVDNLLISNQYHTVACRFDFR